MEFSEIENKVKEIWKQQDVYRVDNDVSLPKYYVLDMFPYPSGAGLHVGHPLGYIASDIVARYKRLKGFNVLHPMGYDSFGLPAEQYAIQTGQHPAITTDENIKTFREQMDKLGFSFDWSRELRTSDPKFYRWTQWIFIQLFNSWYNKKTDKAESIVDLEKFFLLEGNRNVSAVCNQEKIFSDEEWKNFSAKEKSKVLLNYRLAYIADSWVNWCPALGTVLANDEVKDGVSERGGYPVERKLMKQWSMRIVAYADRLLNGLNEIDWSDSIKEAQRNWIGKSEGCSVKFKVAPQKDSSALLRSEREQVLSSALPADRFGEVLGKAIIEVFTTRPDTIFGVSFITLAPEHELVSSITTLENKSVVNDYVHYAKNRSERDRMADVKKITGVFTGAFAIHPFSGKQIPIWIGEYVLASYGTGAVMGVPGHDERDHRFASHFGLEIFSILEDIDVKKESFDDKDGIICNSDFLNGMKVSDAIKKAIDEIEKNEIGKRKINFKLRDAIFGRQRYWGEPIPIYYQPTEDLSKEGDAEGIPNTVDEKDLPIILPQVDKYLPTEDGEPPLARARDWYYRPGADPSLTLPEGERTASRSEEKVLPLGEDLGGVGNANNENTDPALTLPEGKRTASHSEEKVLPFWEDLGGVGKPRFVTADKKTYRHLKELPVEFRKNQTEAEEILWKELKGNKLGEYFRRQHVIDSFIVDFVCLKKKLIVEVDGGIHLSQQEHDKYREAILKNQGFRVIRFWNEEILNNISDVLEKIRGAINEFKDPSLTLPERERIDSRENKVLHFGEDFGGVGGPLELTTMPGWAGSSWYYLRYGDPENENAFASPDAINYWKQIDLYVGGDEHATGHLMYFRFWTKFLFDIGLIPFDEPAKKLVNQGKIQGVSALIERLLLGISHTGDDDWQFANVPNSELPQVFLSAPLAKKRSNKQDGIKEEDEVEELLNKISQNLRLKFNDNSISVNNILGTVPIHIESTFVENDDLNIDQLKAWREEFKDAYFISESNESFKCTRVVEKMSKSKYNTINPDEVVNKYGADCFRMYEMFLGPIEQHKPWDTKGIDGVSRFLKKFWKLFYGPSNLPEGEAANTQASPDAEKLIVTDEEPTTNELKILYRTIKKVEEDVEKLSFNTSVSAFMICVNEFTDLKCRKKKILEPLLITLCPFAPFISEYIWRELGNMNTIVKASFPKYDASLLVENSYEYPVAVNGKTRLKINFALDLASDVIEKEILNNQTLQKYFEGKTPKKVIVVKGRMINVVL